MRRATHLIVAAAVLLGACGSADPASAPAATTAASSAATSAPATNASAVAASPDAVVVEQVAESAREDGPSALDAARGQKVDGLPVSVIPLNELRSGGPPPDGIPPIDTPSFVRTASVDFLSDQEPVLALQIDGEARAYPVQILMWHEIVNDTFGTTPVAVTYCPLCNSAVAYDRRVGDRVLSFGTSGLLWNSALVMYDRQTESLWSHFIGSSIAGVLNETELTRFPVATVPWRVWKAAHPDGLVLSRDTGFDRTYGRNPYPGYDDADSEPLLFEGKVDDRYTAMTRVVGIEHDGASVALPLGTLRKNRTVRVTDAGKNLIVFWQEGAASALDDAKISDGTDIGATGVFVAEIDGRTLTFAPAEIGFTDNETGSSWNLLGHATAGPLVGKQLESVVHVDTFWFAWAAFQPKTTVVES